MCNVENYEELDKYMKKNNFTIEGYLKFSKGKNIRIMDMPEMVYLEYTRYFDMLKKDIDSYDNTKKHILTAQKRGKLLEKMAGLLFFQGNTLFKKAINCRTLTNEIDILVNWSKEALQLNIDRVYEFMGRSFLCECKNYMGSVDVTYVGKFVSLLNVSKTKFGIIFSKDGISGKNIWKDGKGLVRKIALSQGTYIIDITWDDFQKIYNKQANILGIINDKYEAMKHDIDYTSYILKHEQEEEFIKQMNILEDNKAVNVGE